MCWVHQFPIHFHVVYPGNVVPVPDAKGKAGTASCHKTQEVGAAFSAASSSLTNSLGA